jgi:hypothetical protein
MEVVEDQEIIANSCKIVRICLRDETNYDRMVQQFPSLGSILVDKMTRWNTSLPIVQESASALRNYVRKPESARLLRPEAVDVLIDIARDPRFDKVKMTMSQTLKALSKVPELDQRIKLRAATDLISQVPA